MARDLEAKLSKRFENNELVQALVKLAKTFDGGFITSRYREHAMIAKEIARLERKLGPLFEEADVFVSSWAARVGIKDIVDLGGKLKKHSRIMLSAHENYQKFKRGQPRKPGKLALVREIGRLLALAGVRLTDYDVSSKEDYQETIVDNAGGGMTLRGQAPNKGLFAFAVSEIFDSIDPSEVANTRPHLRKAIFELRRYDDFMMKVPEHARRGYVSIRAMLPALKQESARKKKPPARKMRHSRSAAKKRAGSSR